MVLLAIPAVILTAVSLAAFLGAFSWVLDVLANFRVQYAVALTLMAALLFLGHWRRTAAAVAVGALANLAVIVPLYFGPAPATPDGDSLTILSYNLFASNEQFGEVAGYITEMDPDIVFLHEASRPWEVAMEAADLGYEVTRSRSDDLIFGTLVLSRSGDSVVSYGFTIGSPRSVEVSHDGVKVLGIHPLAPTTAERAALRDAQLGFGADWSGRQAGPHVVVGDFNATPWSYPFRRLLADTDLLNSQRGHGISATFPADGTFLTRVPIDHLLHSQELSVVRRSLGPRMGSDHYPLLVELSRE